MKPINQSHCQCDRQSALLCVSGCVTKFDVCTHWKPGKLISPIFPVYCHLWSGCHCWSHSVRLTICFYFVWTGFFFLFFLFCCCCWERGASWIVCQSICCFLLTMTCGFEKRKWSFHFSFFLHLASPSYVASSLLEGHRVGTVSLPLRS